MLKKSIVFPSEHMLSVKGKLDKLVMEFLSSNRLESSCDLVVSHGIPCDDVSG